MLQIFWSKSRAYTCDGLCIFRAAYRSRILSFATCAVGDTSLRFELCAASVICVHAPWELKGQRTGSHENPSPHTFQWELQCLNKDKDFKYICNSSLKRQEDSQYPDIQTVHWQIITPNASVPRDIDPSKWILCWLLQIPKKDRHSIRFYSLKCYFSRLSASEKLKTQGSSASIFLTSPIFQQLLESCMKCHCNTERRKSFPDGFFLDGCFATSILSGPTCTQGNILSLGHTCESWSKGRGLKELHLANWKPLQALYHSELYPGFFQCPWYCSASLSFFLECLKGSRK